jgi:Zn-dependent protease
MFRYMLGGGDLRSYVIGLLLSLPIVLLALSVHEWAHGFASDRLGDPTPRYMGRLTISPRKHLDPIGFVCMLLCGFGWAKPVPIDPRYYKKPRRDVAIVSLAGPLSNLLLAFLFLLLLRFVGFGWLVQHRYATQLGADFASFVLLLFYYGVFMNTTLAVFNLLPCPPLDGSKILFSLLPRRYYFKIAPYERQISFVLMLLLLLGPLSRLINFLTDLILSGMFALVGMGGFLI